MQRQASRASKGATLGKAQDVGSFAMRAVSSPGQCCGDQAPQGSDPERFFLEDFVSSHAGDSPGGSLLQRLQHPHKETPQPVPPNLLSLLMSIEAAVSVPVGLAHLKLYRY